MKHSYAEQHPDVDELITTHSELVRKIACKLWPSTPRYRDEDIIQIGYTA